MEGVFLCFLSLKLQMIPLEHLVFVVTFFSGGAKWISWNGNGFRKDDTLGRRLDGL